LSVLRSRYLLSRCSSMLLMHSSSLLLLLSKSCIVVSTQWSPRRRIGLIRHGTPMSRCQSLRWYCDSLYWIIHRRKSLLALLLILNLSSTSVPIDLLLTYLLCLLLLLLLLLLISKHGVTLSS